MNSDNDSGNSNDAPVHRRRTQGTRSLPPSTSSTSSHQQNAINRSYHLKKEETYSDEDELDEEDDADEDNHHQHTTYRGRGRPSQQQHLIDNINQYAVLSCAPPLGDLYSYRQ